MLSINIFPKIIDNSYFLTIFTRNFLSRLFISFHDKYNLILSQHSKKIAKASIACFDIFLFGLLKGYKVYIEIHGTGYKFRLINTKTLFGLTLRIGYSHLLLIDLVSNIRVHFFNKTMLCFYSNNLWCLNNKSCNLLLQRKKNVYKKKGLFWKNTILTLKKSKKLKF